MLHPSNSISLEEKSFKSINDINLSVLNVTISYDNGNIIYDKLSSNKVNTKTSRLDSIKYKAKQLYDLTRTSTTTRILKLLIARVLLLAICSLAITFNICITKSFSSILFLIPICIIIVETLYIFVKKGGSDFKFFSISSLAYLVTIVVLLWQGVLYKYEKKDMLCLNATTNEEERRTMQICFGKRFNSCEVQILIECIFIFSFVFSRWMTPFHKELDQVGHSIYINLIFASVVDIIDFFDYTNLPHFDNYALINGVLALTALSFFQFSFTLSATKNITRISVGYEYWLDIIFGHCHIHLKRTEIWSILLVTFTQDLPFLIMRSILIQKYGIFVHTTLLFFFLKNIFMIRVCWYRVRSIYKEFNHTIELKKSAMAAIDANQFKSTKSSLSDVFEENLNDFD